MLVMIRVEHPSKSNCSGVCIYCKYSLPLQLENVKYFNERSDFEVNIGDNICGFIFPYRSSDRSHYIFESFFNNFEV